MNEPPREATNGDAPSRDAGFGAWIAGRANRKEYWIWMGPILVAELVLAALPALTLILAGLRLLIFIRRMHDLDWTGWAALVLNAGLTIAGMAVGDLAGDDAATRIAALLLMAAIIALGCIPGQPRENAYGPPPGDRKADFG